MDAPDIKAVAVWLLIGFKKAWSVGELFDSFGHNPDWISLHENYPMFPDYTSKKTPIRAIVYKNFPKLAEKIESGFKTQEQIDAAVKFLCSSVANKNPHLMTNSEAAKMYRDARKFRASGIARAEYFDRNNNGASGWKKCK